MNYQDVIAQIEAEIATLDEKRSALVAAVEGLKALSPQQKRQPVERRRTERRKPQRKAAPPPVADVDEAVFDAVKAGADTKNAIVQATRLGKHTVTYALKKLVAAKRVKAAGKTAGRTFSVKTATAKPNGRENDMEVVWDGSKGRQGASLSSVS